MLLKFSEKPPAHLRVPNTLLASTIPLECAAGGVPVPQIHWFKNGRRLHQAPNEMADVELDWLANRNLTNGAASLQYAITKSRIYVALSDLPMVGRDEYQCVAENSCLKPIVAQTIIEQFEGIIFVSSL